MVQLWKVVPQPLVMLLGLLVNRAIAIGSIRPTEGNLKYPTGVGKDVATGLQGTTTIYVTANC